MVLQILRYIKPNISYKFTQFYYSYRYSSSSHKSLNLYTNKLAHGLLNQSKSALARAITLIESNRDDHRLVAQGLLDHVISVRKSQAINCNSINKAFRIGIAGPPGAVSNFLDHSI